MLLLHIGAYHQEHFTNCQDFGIEHTDHDGRKLKCISDGCSACPNAEVGAKLFCMYVMASHDRLNREVPEEVIKDLYDSISVVLLESEYLYSSMGLFTSLIVLEKEDCFDVFTCGDGVIILEKIDGEMEYVVIEQGPAPDFYMYNYFPEDAFPDGTVRTEISIRSYSKEQYANVGVASDGLNYILKSYLKDSFEESLRFRRKHVLARMLRKYQEIIKDDVVVAF